MKHSFLSKLALVGVASLTLSASLAPTVSAQAELPAVADNDGTPIQGGTLKIALVAAEPFSGAFSNLIADQATDLNVVESYINPGLFEYDENLQLRDTGLA